MHKVLKVLGTSAAVVYFLSTAVKAATITAPITSGFAEVVADEFGGASAEFLLHGPGVSFTGAGGMTAGGPCSILIPSCVPGTKTGVSPFGIGSLHSEDRGVNGTVTIAGETFSYSALVALLPEAGISFAYDFLIPNAAPAPPDTLKLTAPFKGSAFLNAEFATLPELWTGPPLTLIMSGQGVATINLQLLPGPQGPFYTLQSVRYDFTAIPEPGTGALILIGIAAQRVFAMRRRLTGAMTPQRPSIASRPS